MSLKTYYVLIVNTGKQGPELRWLTTGVTPTEFQSMVQGHLGEIYLTRISETAASEIEAHVWEEDPDGFRRLIQNPKVKAKALALLKTYSHRLTKIGDST